MSLSPEELPASARSPVPPPARPAPARGGFDALVRPATYLLFFGFALWLVFAWTRYGERYAQTGTAWRVGGTHMVEIKLARDSIDQHACASDAGVDGLACGYLASRKPAEPPRDEAHTLRPYTTVRGESFLGAGLWSSPDLRGKLPSGKRFTVVCNLHVQAVVRSVALRYKSSARFHKSKSTLAAGALTDCAFPR